MNPPEAAYADEPFMSLLVACDQALAARDASDDLATSAELAPELRERLDGDLACIQLLRQLLPRRSPVRDPAVHADAPAVELGHFQVRQELGRGAFGVVFLAYDTNLKRLVALKIPRPEALPTTELRQRFLREARAAAGLDHPNLVPVYEVFADGPVCYIASAYCPGITLAAWLKERNLPVPVREAAQTIATLADAVQHAHGRGVVHRDLKPANILLQKSEEPDPESESPTALDFGSRISDFTPKITDFGLAKFISAEDGTVQTQTGAILGTPSYMAPEQASRHDQKVGPAADVYALGAILYELLVGRPPFRGETTLDTLEMVRSEEPVPPRRLVPKLPRDLETICLKCLEKDPAKRYASAAALAHDLQAFLAGKSIEARPPRLWERGVKGARRHPALATLLLVLGVATAVVVAMSVRYQAHLRKVNRDLATALAKANSHRQQEDANLQMARKVVRSAHDPRFGAQQHWLLRAEELQDAIPVYDDVVRRYPREADLQAERGTIYLQLGRLLSEARTIPLAEPSFAKAEAIFRQLVHDSPAVPAFEALLGKACLSQGLVAFETYRLELAEQYYREAFALGETVSRRAPAIEEYQVLLAQGHIMLAGLYLDTDRLEAAETAMAHASAFAEELGREHPGVLTYRAVQVASLNALGALYHRTGRFEQAKATFLKARGLSEKLVSEQPAIEDYQSRLGRSLGGLADAYSALGDVKAAEQAYDRAYIVFVAQCHRQPSSREIHNDWAATVHNLAVLYLDSGQPALVASSLNTIAPIYLAMAFHHPSVLDYQAWQAAGHNVHGVWCRVLEQELPQVETQTNLAMASISKVVRDDTTRASYRATLSRVRNNISAACLDTGRPQLAAAAFEEARAVAEPLVRAHPTVLDHALDLGAIYQNLGHMDGSSGKPQDALEWYTRSVQLLEDSLKALPQRAAAWRYLAVAYAGRATVLAELHRDDEMRRDLARMRELDPKPDLDHVRLYRARMLTRPAKPGPRAPATGATSGPGSPGPEIPYRLGFIYLLDPLSFRQQTPLP